MTSATNRRSAAVERLAGACAEPGCPVCRVIERDARRDLAALLREQTMDPVGRATLRAAGGFCGWHTALLREAADGIVSVAILAEDLLRDPPRSRAACPACVPLRDHAEAYLRALLAHAEQPALDEALRRGPGLPCRPHLERLRATTEPDARLGTLERLVAARLGRLRADLGAFIAKQDYRSAAPPTPDEARAWSEALEHLAGAPWLRGSDLGRG